MLKTMQKAVNTEDRPFGHLLASRPGRSGKGTFASMMVSIMVHGAVMGGLLWATGAFADEQVPEATAEEITIVELPPEVQLPPPPPPAEAPAPTTPEVPRGFQTLAIPEIVPTDIPPPNPGTLIKPEDFTGVGVKGGRATGTPVEVGNEKMDISAAPRFTPMTVPPRILNSAEVIATLERTYPPLLRDAGIGGDVTVWFFIDENGRVLKRQVDQSSGYQALDDAALKVAEIMRFSPAQNRDKKVQVWVSLPVRFSTR